MHSASHTALTSRTFSDLISIFTSEIERFGGGVQTGDSGGRGIVERFPARLRSFSSSRVLVDEVRAFLVVVGLCA